MHSLHSYFLRPGDTAVPIVYDVERLRDGRSFATRRVVARQHGRPIYFLTASFQRAEDGLRAPGRDARGAGARGGPRPRRAGRRRGAVGRRGLAKEWAALDVAATSATPGYDLPDDPSDPPGRGSGSGSTAGSRDDPVDHLAAFTYASDMTLLGADAGRRTA